LQSTTPAERPTVMIWNRSVAEKRYVRAVAGVILVAQAGMVGLGKQ